MVGTCCGALWSVNLGWGQPALTGVADWESSVQEHFFYILLTQSTSQLSLPLQRLPTIKFAMIKGFKISLLTSLLLLFGALSSQDEININALFHAHLDSLNDNEKFEEVLPLVYPALEKSRKEENWSDLVEETRLAAAALYGLEQYDTCNRLVEKNLLLLQMLNMETTESGSLYSYLAYNYIKQENYPAAITAYKEAISIFEKLHEVGDAITYCYKNIAQPFLRRDDFPKAIFYLESALKTDTSGTYLASIYSQLANCYHYQNNEKLVMEYCQKGFATPILTGKDKANLQATVYTAYLAEGRPDEAIKMLKEALDFYPKEERYANNRLRSLTALGNIYYSKGLIPLSEKMFKDAEAEGKIYYPKKSREMAKLYVEWGDLQKKQGKNNQAMLYYQKALTHAWPNFNSLDINANPVGQYPPIELWAMYAASRKAALLTAPKNVTPADRLNAADCFDLAFAVAAQLRKVYDRDETKLYFQQNNYNLRVEAIKNLWAIHANESDSQKGKNLYRIFDIFETERAATLRDALVRFNALNQSGLPDSLQQQEENERRGVAELRNLLDNAKIAGDTALIRRHTARILTQQRKYDALLYRLEKQYPKLVEYNHADDFTAALDLQKNISDSSVILSWFDSGDRYYCVVLSQKNAAGFVVEKDSIVNHALNDYLQLLINPDLQASSPDTYYAAARKLCLYFLPDEICANYQSITIIPDGQLSYVPFEALLTKDYKGKYANAPYVLAAHNIRYAWAASLLNDTRSEKASSDGMLFMAPFEGFSRDNFPQLPSSKEENPAQMSAQSFVNTSGSTTAFLKNAKAYNIIHLATHAHADETGGSKIEFADRSISADEIYNYHFNASLVSLSACETGVGKYYSGEGVMSLARAFAYAGAQSLVASLWQVNDRSTASIFKSFYEQISAGKTKSASLRSAKLAYLQSDISEAAKTPWHWAAFTLLGKDDIIVQEAGFFSGLPGKIVILGSIALLLFLFFRKKRS